ncbi:hypothetical protein NIES4073_18310 [Kalymmatonema gypsitolerans NIES-4073]|nr:hypothetical protein NIES4073_18310 [Scytonema sp. NIES-4073]
MQIRWCDGTECPPRAMAQSARFAMARSARQRRWRRAPASRWHEVPARGDGIGLHPEYEERMEWVGESLSV